MFDFFGSIIKSTASSAVKTRYEVLKSHHEHIINYYKRIDGNESLFGVLE